MILNRQQSIFFKSYPVTRLKNQIITGFIIGLSVSFILIIFQPFGTYEFRMDYKSLFLLGYGIICATVYSVYYFLLMTLIKKWFAPQKWNIAKEIVTVIPVLIIMPIASFYYYNIVILDDDIMVNDFGYFFLLSIAIGVIPLTTLSYHKYLKSKLTSVKSSESSKGYIITIESNNKKEKSVVVKSEELIYIKSNGNYIEISMKSSEKPLLMRNSLNYVEGKLPKSEFLKIHRSYIVNIKSLDSLILSGSSYAVKINGADLLIPVSRSAVKALREIIS